MVRELSGATIRATAEALGLSSTTVRDWLRQVDLVVGDSEPNPAPNGADPED